MKRILPVVFIAVLLTGAGAAAADWRADVTHSGNHIWLRAARPGAFQVLVHPDMVNLDENLIITVNWEVVHDARVEPDLEFMIGNSRENRDRKLLYVAAVDVMLETKKEAAR